MRQVGMTFVYFVQAENGLVKIGCTKYVDRRVVALQAFSPLKLELIAFAPGTLNDELYIHAFLDAERAHGEWFYPREAVVKLLTTVKLMGLLPPFVRSPKFRYPKTRKKRISHAAEIRAKMKLLEQEALNG